jgi:DNA-binding transcriptional LysR family regulator
METWPPPDLQDRELRARDIDLIVGRLPSPDPADDIEAEILFHARIGVVAARASPWSRRRKVALADEAVARIDALFEIERDINGKPPPQRHRVRAEHSRPPLGRQHEGTGNPFLYRGYTLLGVEAYAITNGAMPLRLPCYEMRG